MQSVRVTKMFIYVWVEFRILLVRDKTGESQPKNIQMIGYEYKFLDTFTFGWILLGYIVHPLINMVWVPE